MENTGMLSTTCECGKVQVLFSEIRISESNRLVCGCEGCRGYTRFLGRSEEMLDSFGGSDIFQTSPAKLKINYGMEFIKAVRQTTNGCVRWYASCCKTGICNTLISPGVPFVGILVASLDQKDPRFLEKAIGPIRIRVNSPKEALGFSFRKLISMLIRYGLLLVKWRLAGDHKRSPFFQSDGKPIVSIYQMNIDEYQKYTR